MTGTPFPVERPASAPPSRLAASMRGAAARERVVPFAAVGVISTVVFAVLYSVLRRFVNPIEANVAAQSLTMAGNFVANRWLTFRAGGGSLVAHASGYLAVYLVGLAASSLLLHLTLLVLHAPTGLAETGLAVTAGGIATVIRYVLLSAWVFRGDVSVPPDGGGA